MIKDRNPDDVLTEAQVLTIRTRLSTMHGLTPELIDKVVSNPMRGEVNRKLVEICRTFPKA